MLINKREIESRAINLFVERDGKQVGRVSLFLIYNDLHKEPYGFIEDLYVEEESRGEGIGTALIKEIINEAKSRNCYKLIATSRFEREKLHKYYLKFGFKSYGYEFRLDLKELNF